MKHHLGVTAVLLIFTGVIYAQDTTTFNGLLNAQDTFANGSEGVDEYITQSGLFMAVRYDTSFNYWASGFAISNRLDTSDGSFSNLYSAYVEAPDTQNTYAVANLGEGPVEINTAIPLDGNFSWKSMKVCNTTYAFKSMLQGDQFAKQFGGPSGDDPDYFFIRFKSGNDSLDFYLADFRSSNNTEDYIISGWTTVDLSSFEGTPSLSMQLFSSDTGQFGINTPLFFALDDVVIDISVGVKDEVKQTFFSTWSDGRNLHYSCIEDGLVQIFDISGRRVYQQRITQGEGVMNALKNDQMIIVRFQTTSGKQNVQKAWH